MLRKEVRPSPQVVKILLFPEAIKDQLNENYKKVDSDKENKTFKKIEREDVQTTKKKLEAHRVERTEKRRVMVLKKPTVLENDTSFFNITLSK
ncbi:unnamed protein product, partial [Timema podura]|nr:unnamed protein product [Timema podura]